MKRLIPFLLAIVLGHTASAQIDTISIDSIQWRSQTDLANCDDLSRYDGDTVVFAGTVLVDGSLYGSSSHNIQVGIDKPFGGMRFRTYNSNYTAQIPNLAKGDSIIAIGTLSQYQGETQFEPLDQPKAITVVGAGTVPSAVAISVGDLNDNSRQNILETGEQYESRFVKIEDVTVVSVDPFSGNRVSFVVEDASGNRVNIGDHFMAGRIPSYTHPTTGDPGTFITPSVGDKYDSIRGIVIHSSTCAPNSGRGYEIHPYDASHYSAGASAPRISNFTVNPSSPTSADNITISADIRDLDGSIVSAEVKYIIGQDPNGSVQTLTMTNTSGAVYEATIPKQADGTFIMYQILAEDDSTNTTYQPNASFTNAAFAFTVRDNGLSIYDLQFTPWNSGNSLYINKSVTVTGRVTASAADLGRVFIQDQNTLGGWSGIELTGGNAGLTNLKIGQLVEVTGKVEENFGFTALNVSNIVLSDPNELPVNILNIVPDSLSSYSFERNEQYEGVLANLINTDQNLGNGLIHIVDTNSDAPSNFGEYRVGRDPFDPTNSCRVLTGRSGYGSQNVSFINNSYYEVGLNDTALYVRDTMNMDTLRGVISYSFYNIKILPRNNDDFIGINVDISKDTTQTEVSYLMPPSSNLMKMFPNPANGTVNVLLSEEVGVHTVTITSMEGKQVFVRSTIDNAYSIPLHQIEAGHYIVTVQKSEGIIIDRQHLIID